jgi:TonB family protein
MIKADARTFWLIALLAAVVCGPLHAADNQVRVIPDSQLKQWWQATHANHNAIPQYPIDAIREGVEGCMTVAFEIQGDGSVSNERIWRDETPKFHETKAWEQATLLTIHQWHFVPAPANKERAPVYTYQVVTFTMGGDADNPSRDSEIKAKCEMTDFPQQVQAMINTKKARQKP